MKKENCVIVDDTVTQICTMKMMQAPPAPRQPARRRLQRQPQLPQPMCMMHLAPIPPQHLTIGGTISTTNIIMANWSTTMWQSVVNRAVRMLASGPFRLHFSTVSAVVSGN
ncbi:hypothetical protein KIN20_027904 [Parelaphostrongylus tenuis]|uniref:Uncharacterized protein n=1 Tax=Parelaphostrongylus tenuis TaxID=148309 RepID=A0AAD5R0A4_PARTN|nr:hypothetical protein KIN20_027904 [Parelaphostrongylus tenuis]